jgi:MarR family transcriptional regulator, organic hydroperoxide resistance regulator
MDAIVFEIQRLYPRIFHACHVRHVRRRSTPFALSEREASLLAHLDHEHGSTARDLAKHMGVGAPTMSAALKRLERLGYIERGPRDRDRRTSAVRSTETGRRALSAASVLDAEKLSRLVARLSPNERKAAVRGLALLANGPSKEAKR